MKNKNLIGFSTNDLYYEEISFDEKIRFCKDIGGNAIELGLNSVKDILKYEVNEGIFDGFDFISIHAPKINKEDSKKVFDKLRVLCDKIGVKAIVIHYDEVDDFEMFDKSGLPFAVENMDSDKLCGASFKELKEIHDKYDNLKFVLDLQHAYEEDSSMMFARDFVKVLGDRLSHMHVSGRNGKVFHHLPVCVADNGKAIESILKLSVGVPIILEGLLDENYKELAKRELDYVRGLSLYR